MSSEQPANRPPEWGTPKTAPSAYPPFPVVENVVKAYTDIIENPGVVANLGGCWLVLFSVFFVVMIGVLTLLMGDQPDVWPFSGIGVGLAIFAGLALAMSSVAVGWHRFLLLAERPPAYYLALGKPVWRYLLAFIAITIMATIVSMFAGLFLGILGAAFGLVGLVIAGGLGHLLFLLVFAACAIVLPDVAIGRSLPISEAMDRLSGNTWRLAIASFLVTLPATLATYSEYLLPTATMIASGSYLQVALSISLFAVSTLAGIGLLSLAWRHVSDRAAPIASTEPAPSAKP